MVLRQNLSDREYDKFTTTADGKTAIRASIEDAQINLDGDVAIDVAAFQDTSGDDKNALVDDENRIILSEDSEPLDINAGAIAETTVPTAVSDGARVAQWHNEYGQQVLYGANLSANAMDANVVNQALLNTITSTMLSAVTAIGASSVVDVSNYNKLTFHIVASSVTTGGTMKIQHSIDGTNYADVAEETISANGVTEVVVENRKYKFVRVNLTARTDGTYSVFLFGGC